MALKLITEINEDVEYLIEGEGNSRRTYIQGVFAEADVENRNHRRYPMPILEKEVGRYVKEHVIPGRGYGELGHPAGSSINLDRVCILIREMIADKNAFIGKALVSSNPMGKIVEGLINDGAHLGVSTRALGSLKPISGGINEVQADLRLLAVDVVADPSAPNAFVNGIMEGVDYIYDAAKGVYMEQYLEDTRKALHKLSNRQIEEAKLVIFEDFLHNLTNKNR